MERTGTEWTGPDRIGLEGTGFPSCIHKGVESRGGDRSGKEGIGLDGLFHSCVHKGPERNGPDRIVVDRR